MPRLVPEVVPAGALGNRPQPVIAAAGGLALRPWEATDAPDVVAAFEDPAIRHWHHRSMTPQEAADWVAGTAEGWTAETDAEWAVVREGDLLGRVALRGIELAIGQADVSYWTVAHARGRGVASRAASALAGWALDEVGFWRLELRHSTRNPASCGVATRAGFRSEAVLERQHLHDDGWHDVHVHTRFRDAGGGRGAPPPV